MRVSFTSSTAKRYIFIFFLLVVFVPLFYSTDQVQKQPQKASDKICAECHEDVAKAFKKNIHAKNEKTKGYACVSCHGPCKQHVEEPDAESIYHPRNDFLRTGKNPCLTCHTGDKFESADKTSHSEAANGCCDCHVVHSHKKQLLKSSPKKLCFECHQDVYAKFRLTSHHPVVEGMMTCQNCHPVHGGNAKFTLNGSNNELCISCHTSKEGPFIYEHQPVNEDCSICHDPHGTVANNLLVQNEPALCMSCHPMHFHSGLTAYNGKFTTPLDPKRGGISRRDGLKAALLTKCTQCHNKIHGTDSGSQSLSSQGKSLIR
jgi:DmsE family decaheme c-type cytochrome